MFSQLLPLVALAIRLVQAESRTTWLDTSYVTDYYYSTTIVKYGSVAVTPVPTTSPYTLVTSYINEPLASKDITVTTWVTVTVSEPFYTTYVVVHDPTLPGNTVTSNTSTVEVWTSPTLATITISTTTCTNGVTPSTTKTKYTGTYCPIFPGQVTTLPKVWPTEVVSIFNDTAVYRVYTYVGTTTTATSTFSVGTFLATTTITTTVPTATGRYKSTTYLTTVTVTSSDWQLDYTTRTVSKACAATPTVTRAAQCAPTNMLSQRDGYGVAINFLPDSWRIPIEFTGEILGMPGFDASECCQLCLDNKGCAASEWMVGPVNPASCALYFYGYGNSTCGVGVPLEYYADTWDQPRQGSYLQLGCGSFTYIGVHSDLY